MKRIIVLVITVLLVSSVFAQTELNTIQKQIPQTNRAAIEKKPIIVTDQFKSKVSTTLQQIEAANLKTSTTLKTSLNTKISSYINTTLKSRTIDKSIFTDPNRPYITEVYCPDPAGVKPYGEFLLIGANLLSNSGTPTVTVKLGQTSIACTPSYSNSTSEWLWVYINDFSGITTASQVTVTVTSNNLTSAPANITILPELVTQRLNLTYFINQLKTENRSTNPMTYAATVQEATRHSFTVLYSDILWVNHSFPIPTYNGTTYRGDDEFFLNAQIKNNWKVKQIIFYDNRSVCGTVADNQISAALHESGVNSSSLRVKIGWINFEALCYQSGYTITWLVEGPKGTNYW
jgi:hypothetical protein